MKGKIKQPIQGLQKCGRAVGKSIDIRDDTSDLDNLKGLLRSENQFREETYMTRTQLNQVHIS